MTLALMLAAMPVQAQDDGTEEMREGAELLEKGMQLLLEGLVEELGPILLELQGKIVDLSAYHAPEILPNGDIIIRRKVPLEPEEKPDGEIEL